VKRWRSILALDGARFYSTRRKACISVAAFLIFAGSFTAPAAERTSKQFVTGTVVRVQKQRVESPEYTIGGSNPSDAPLTFQYYAYEVSIRVGCEIYTGRYETPFNYLPSAFSSDRQVSMRLTKHVMYFDLPNNPDLRMGIVHRKSVCDSQH
jgi:hypothetical protein